MRARRTDRGFIVVEEEQYKEEPREFTRLIQESSTVGDYDDAMSNPGSSFLWIGRNHHLDREGVAELIERMQYWLDNKRLKLD